MKPIEFNLLYEPWIRVMKPDCTVEEVSITDALCRAQEYRALAGELPTQDVAILRLLLAVLYTVFSRVNAEGEEENLCDLEEDDDVVEHWRDLWNKKQFPPQPILEYLKKWEDRFWLFHPEKPFYQVNAAQKGSFYNTEKLVGELSKSNNKGKLRLIMNRRETGISYGEAARWLVSINGFDDSSTKTETGTGSGYLGQLGNIYAEGDSLFETLMLNLVLLRDGEAQWEEEPRPHWEKEPIIKLKKRAISVPQNQPELLTLQSRRLYLKREADLATGYFDGGGDFFPDGPSLTEQYALWGISKNKGKKNEIYSRKLQPERMAWRDFGYIVIRQDEGKRPGVINWIEKINHEIPHRRIRFRLIGVRYDSKGSSVIEVVADQLDFQLAMLSKLNDSWVRMVGEQIDLCDKVAGYVKILAERLEQAAGGSGDNNASLAQERFYHEIDVPFRMWLMSIDPDNQSIDTKDEKEREWNRIAFEIARHLGNALADEAGIDAYVGREVKIKQGGKENVIYCSTASELRSYRYKIYEAFHIEAKKEEN